MRFALLSILFAFIAGMALAQVTDNQDERTPILTIDQDRLFSETRPGIQLAAAVEAEILALAEENRRIEAELLAEELALSEERAELSAEDFTVKADEFDAKVRQIRQEQDAKAREINQLQNQVQQRFFAEISGILSDIVQERDADVVLDRRSVFISADSVDITEEAISRINAEAEQRPLPLDMGQEVPPSDE